MKGRNERKVEKTENSRMTSHNCNDGEQSDLILFYSTGDTVNLLELAVYL